MPMYWVRAIEMMEEAEASARKTLNDRAARKRR
jgi:hypothetical protein